VRPLASLKENTEIRQMNSPQQGSRS